MGACHRYIYVSRVNIPDHEVASELEAITAVARRHNVDHRVSSALLRSDGRFAQVLEGPEDSVVRILDWIRRDQRHCDLRTIEDAPRPRRAFLVGMVHADVTDMVVGFIQRLHLTGPTSGDVARLLALMQRHAA